MRRSLFLPSLIALIALLFAAPRIALPQTSAPGPLTKVKAASILLINNMPAYIAKELGYFRDEGIDFDIVEVRSGAAMSQALISGSVDVATTTIERPMQLYEKGIVVKNMVGMLMRSNYAIVVSPNFKGKLGDIKSLKGLKLGMSGAGSGSDTTLRGFLRDNGLDPDKDVTLIAVGADASSVAAMGAGTIDGMIAWEPNLSAALGQNVAKLFIDLRDPKQGGKWYRVANTTIQATDRWIKQNPKAAEAVVRAVVRADRTIRTDRETTLRVMRQLFTKLDANTLARVCDVQCPAFDPVLSEEIHTLVNGVFKDAGQLKTVVPYEAITAVQFRDLWR